LWEETFESIGAWKDAPFRPHLVARYRQSAYMLTTVMAYLDNLIAWGDSLFAQDTGEAINEATQLYVMAANILGTRPQAVPKRGSVGPMTYAALRPELDAFSNAQVALEAEIPFDIAPPPPAPGGNGQTPALGSVGQTLFFCIPRNDKLLGYWDTVADRLFKIRNSLNLQGVFRQLPLFDPPIDPGLLAKAAAGGIDVGAVVSGANQPLPLVRFQVLAQKATELCQEVKSLGAGLLAAIEKRDGEALSVLRARQERVMLALGETVRYGQVQEAAKAREGLERSIQNATERLVYYERLLGRQASEVTVPELEELDADAFRQMKLRVTEPEIAPRPVPVDIAADPEGLAGGMMISSHELREMTSLEEARQHQVTASVLELVGSILGLIPQFDADVKPIGIGAGFGFGGVQLSRMLSGMAAIARIAGDQASYEAGKMQRIGGYARREQEWAFQSNLAAGEITQTFRQLRAAQIREAIAEQELASHRQQMAHAEDIERFLTGERNTTGHQRVSTEALYAWMKREAKGLHAEAFKLAFDVARKAERALQHELGDPGATFLQPGYLAGTEGLLAGESLHLDLKRMEVAFQDRNRREYELTKHVSVLQLNPRALVELRTTGRCAVVVPEEAFDMDGPGHYFRRLKSVAVSIPCLAGPYASVNCTLTQTKSSIRRSPQLRDGGYAREGAEDDRFSDHFGSSESIVTSSAQNDSGLFEPNLRDDRYLPFEGSGAIAEWQLTLPGTGRTDPRQFDYGTISDVILHLRYTAREGGVPLRDAAMANLVARIDEAQATGSVQLFSVRHDFATEWARFTSGPATDAPLTIAPRPEHYPFWSAGRLQAVRRIDIFAAVAGNITVGLAGSAVRDALGGVGLGDLKGTRLTETPAAPTDPIP
ncbi:MAG: insecticidal toxin protein, partial [Thermoleophilia bacterium]